MVISLVLFGLMSLKKPEEGGPLTGAITEDAYNCDTYIKFPVLETDQYYLTINEHRPPSNSQELRLNVFSKDLEPIKDVVLKGLYYERRKVSRNILESFFLDGQGEPCVLYSTFDTKKDKLRLTKARVDLVAQTMVDPITIMEYDAPGVSGSSRVDVSHTGIGKSHDISLIYRTYSRERIRHVEEHFSHFNEKFEPELKEFKGDERVLYNGKDISSGSWSFLLRTSKLDQCIGSNKYRFDFFTEKGVLKILEMNAQEMGRSLAVIELNYEYDEVETYYDREESTITFFSFNFFKDEEGRSTNVKGFSVCKIDATKLHRISEESYTFSDQESAKILADIDELGNSKGAKNEDFISPFRFRARVKFLSSERFVVVLRRSRTNRHDEGQSHIYGDFAYMGYSGKGALDFLNGVHVEESISDESVGGELTTFEYKGELYLLYKNDGTLKYQKLGEDGALIDLKVDKDFAQQVEELVLDFSHIELQPGTFVLSATGKRMFHVGKFYLVRMTLPE